MWNYLYLGVCLLFSLLLLFFIKTKQRIKSKENELFNISVYLCVFSVATELILQYITLTLGLNNFITIIFNKIYLLSIIIWFVIFSKYVFYIFKPDAHIDNYEFKNAQFLRFYNIIDKIHNGLGILFSIIICVLPIQYFLEGTKMYSYGPAVDVLKIAIGIFMLSWAILSICHYKRMFNIKYLPIFVAFLLLIFNIILQHFEPTMLIVSFTFTFLGYILFHTIENPDVKMLEQMELAKNYAEKANRAKTDFLSSMSHEIRTPLNAIVGLSEDNLTYKDQMPAEVLENSQDIINASQTLLEIVGNILDINKIEANKMEIVESVYNFREEIVNMCKVTATRIGEKNINFTLSIARDMPYEFVGDKAKVKTIINNLLSNAIKYTDEGQVNLNIKCINDISQKKSNIIITCQDTGKGIKPELVNRLFTKFDRLEVERNTTVEGTGLGLAITKSLVDMMGGKINVQSRYGKGSIFMVQIPQTIYSLNSHEMTPQNPTNSENISVSYEPKKILIVDDNPLNIKVARRALKNFDFEIDEALEGQECLDKINSGCQYDLILMDIMMPNMSGQETLKRLKEISNFNIPVIALTADAVAEARDKYLALGFKEYIAKPFTKEQIKEKLDKIFTF